MEVIELAGLPAYDDRASIDLEEARKLMRGRNGAVAIEVARRWCHRGHQPKGKGGPVLYLPAVKVNHEWRTMPEWVAAFERKRVELGRQAAPAVPAARPERARKAGHKASEEYLAEAGVK